MNDLLLECDQTADAQSSDVQSGNSVNVEQISYLNNFTGPT